MKEAFYYMFKDNKFWVKALSYLGLFFVANVFLNYAQTLVPPCPRCAPPLSPEYWIFYILGTVISFIPLGYFFSTIKALIEQEDNYILPYINVLKNLFKGFKYTIALMLFIVPCSILSAIIIILGTVLAKAGIPILLGLSTILLVIVGIFLLIITIGFNWLYANEDTWVNFYRFKKVFSLISPNKKLFFIGVGLLTLVVVLNIIWGIICTAAINIMHPINTITGIIINDFLAAVVATYAMYVVAYLTAKSIKA